MNLQEKHQYRMRIAREFRDSIDELHVFTEWAALFPAYAAALETGEELSFAEHDLRYNTLEFKALCDAIETTIEAEDLAVWIVHLMCELRIVGGSDED